MLPIVAYGFSILRQVCTPVTPMYNDLNSLIQQMWQTLDHADGVGLAAPQVNHGIRLFLVDSAKIYKSLSSHDENKYEDMPGIRKVFINPTILNYSEVKTKEEEGCLSIPEIYIPIERSSSITIEYLDEKFVTHTATYRGKTARIIQHEYDHIMGKLYLDYLSPLQKALLKNKLEKIRKGKIKAPYKLLYP